MTKEKNSRIGQLVSWWVLCYCFVCFLLQTNFPPFTSEVLPLWCWKFLFPFNLNEPQQLSVSGWNDPVQTKENSWRTINERIFSNLLLSQDGWVDIAKWNREKIEISEDNISAPQTSDIGDTDPPADGVKHHSIWSNPKLWFEIQ